MRQRAWLTAVAAALGVSEAACHRDAKDGPAEARDVSTAVSASSVALEAPPAPSSSTTVDVATMSAEPSASRSQITHLSCGLGTQGMACGGKTGSPPSRPAIDIQTTVAGGIGGDDRVILLARPRMRACANQALRIDPSQVEGKVVLSIAVAASGEVTTSTVVSTSGLIQSTAACMAARMRPLQFPAGSARTLTVAIVQTKSNS
jgi:hypothetical protein